MIEGKILKFGTGDIEVDGGNSILGELRFQQIKPPQEVGTSVVPGTVEYIGNPVVFDDCANIYELLQKARLVKAGEMLTFECCGYIFDFSEGDPRSIGIVIKHAVRVLDQFIQLMAC